MKQNKALLIVDVQNDFCPGGALAVLEGDRVVPALNRYIQLFSEQNLPIFASRDWHPKKTKHFKTYGGPWPEHCVQDSFGAMFHPDLKLPDSTVIVSKGMDPQADGYSAFEATNRKGRSFLDVLKKLNVGELFVGGLATDYCVKASVLEALQQGFDVFLLGDAIKGVNVNPHDAKEAVESMHSAGAKSVTIEDLSLRK